MRSTTELRDEILAAARSEFAQYGLAGARIDRIAKAAQASKERLYAHFGDKESLFRQIVSIDGAAVFRAVKLVPEDVPGFVGQIFDFARQRPDHMRMVGWARLEGFALEPPFSDSENFFTDLHAGIRQAQARGLVDPIWDPPDLLIMLFGLGLSWAHWPDPRVESATTDAVATRRRTEAIEAARRVLSPPVAT